MGWSGTSSLTEALPPLQSVGVPGLRPDPILILFIIFPGLIFTKCYIYGNRKSDTLGRWDKIGFVLGGSIISGTAFLYIYQNYQGTTGITRSQLGEWPLIELLYAIALQSASAALIGFLLGAALHKMGDQTYRTLRDREDPWEYTVVNIRDTLVQIETRDGDEVEGIVARYESGNGDDDILISRVAPGHEREFLNRTKSNAVFLSGEEISKIHFRDDDPAGEEFNWPEGDSDFEDEELEKLREKETELEDEADLEEQEE